jgi:hypothetical protein
MNFFKRAGPFLMTMGSMAGLFGCSPVMERQPDFMNDADRVARFMFGGKMKNFDGSGVDLSVSLAKYF